MNWIRTTISLREDVYDDIRRLAMLKRMSMSKVINHKFMGDGEMLSKVELEKKSKEGWDFLTKLSKKAKYKIDVVKAVREMRDRQAPELARQAGL